MKFVIKNGILILCILLLFTSCTNNSETPENKTDVSEDKIQNEDIPAETDDGIFYDNVPELNFDGYEYRVIVGEYGRENQDLYPEEEIGDILNDTIYIRNKKIEERFNIEFKSNTINLFELLTTLKKDVTAGSDSYDVYMQIDRDAYTAATEHLLYPIDELPYIDLSKPYWSPMSNKALSVAGKLPWAFSDEMLSHFEYTLVTYFNKKQHKDLGLEDIYDFVRNGKWTHDRFFEYAKAAVKDTDGDGKMTEADNWGIASDPDYMYACFTVCSGVNMVEKDSGDIPYFAVPSNQKFFEIAERVMDQFNSMDGIYMDPSKVRLPSYGGQDTNARVGFFRNGHSLFSIGAIQEMVQLRDMPDDFGVVPFPKYTEDQPQYYTRVIGGFPFVVPTTNPKPEIVGAVMEAMACETRNMVIPAYYESSLQAKYSRDTDTAEMLDLIFDTRVYDLGDTIWYSPIRVDYTAIFASGKNTFASATEKNMEKYNTVIEKAVASILDYERK